jgi:hypothetical protein
MAGDEQGGQGEQAPYDPNRSCGDYGGMTIAGTPCKHPAGYQNPDPTDPCCKVHGRQAQLEMATKKAQILELLPESGNITQVASNVGAHVRTIFEWRRLDGEFRVQFDVIMESRDKGRAMVVEDKVFDRILNDRASPAETIFFLKNRDPDRWKDVYKTVEQGDGEKDKAGVLESNRAKLLKRMTEMSRRMRGEVLQGTSERAAAAQGGGGSGSAARAAQLGDALGRVRKVGGEGVEDSQAE